MRAEFHYDERAALQAGLDALMRYNHALHISIEEHNIDIPTVSAFLKAEPDSLEERELAKMLVIAAKDTFLTHPDIPERNRCRCALRGAEEFHLALEGAKNDYLKEIGYFGAGLKAEEKYNQRQKANIIVSEATKIDRIKGKLKNVLKEEGVKEMAAFVIGVLGLHVGGIAVGASVLATEIIIEAIPDETKKKVKDNAVNMMHRAGAQIKSVAERLVNTPVGQKVSNVYKEYVEPVLERGAEKIVRACNSVKAGVKSAWTWMKSHLS